MIVKGDNSFSGIIMKKLYAGCQQQAEFPVRSNIPKLEPKGARSFKSSPKAF